MGRERSEGEEENWREMETLEDEAAKQKQTE